jgi:hypothetical protein
MSSMVQLRVMDNITCGKKTGNNFFTSCLGKNDNSDALIKQFYESLKI